MALLEGDPQFGTPKFCQILSFVHICLPGKFNICLPDLVRKFGSSSFNDLKLQQTTTNLNYQ